jgi:hypothetical protein
VGKCKVEAHRQYRVTLPGGGPANEPALLAARPNPDPAPVRDPPDALAERDANGVAWWLLDRLILEGSDWDARARVIGPLLRLAATIPPAGASRAEALAETALRGVLMHGIPPRNTEEWALAERLFDDAALAEFRRWKALGEADGDDGPEPLPFGYLGADDADVAIGIDQ